MNSGSVIARSSIPVLHSCAAMLKIAEMEYSGGNSIFLRYRMVFTIGVSILSIYCGKLELYINGVSLCGASR